MRPNVVISTSCQMDSHASTGNCEMTGYVSWSARLVRWKTALTNTIVSDVSESALKVCPSFIAGCEFVQC